MTGNPIPLSLTDPVAFAQPLDAHDAREALRQVAESRRQARDWYMRALANRAEKERDYRKARASTWALSTEGTAKEREDLVNERTSDQRYERDIADGIVRAALERIAEVDGERASLHRLIDWSMRLDPLAAEQPSGASSPIGGRRAA